MKKSHVSGSYSNLNCPLCNLEPDTQGHLLKCEKLDTDTDLISSMPEYRDIFSENLEAQVLVARIIQSRFKKRKQLLKK